MSSPLAKFNKVNQVRWDVFVDFPNWEQNAILNWVHALLCPQDIWGQNTYQYSILSTIQSSERIMIKEDLGIPIENWNTLNSFLSGMIKSTDIDIINKVLVFLELLVKYVRDTSSSHRFGTEKSVSSSNILKYLDNMLGNGSKWTIVYSENSESGLVERISPELMDTAKNSNNADLFKAWNYAFGAIPNPEQAIIHAQSAIEYISSKRGLTNATSKVYGTLLGDIKKHKSKIYKSIARPEFSKSLSLSKQSDSSLDDMYTEWFSSGMDIIQKSNPARHKSKETENFYVSSDAAKQAVLIATSLYEMIDKKYVYKSK